MASACECGCGELLPEGSIRRFKRGHKQRLETTDVFDNVETEPDTQSGDLNNLTIDDVAKAVPDDPEPKDQPEYKPRSQVKITAALRRDVEGKLGFIMVLSGSMWVMADPICGTAFVDHAPEIAKKLTPIICQSPDVVKWLTRSGKYVLWLDLVMACWPVLQMIFAHHIAKTIVQREPGDMFAGPVSNDYVVQ